MLTLLISIMNVCHLKFSGLFLFCLRTSLSISFFENFFFALEQVGKVYLSVANDHKMQNLEQAGEADRQTNKQKYRDSGGDCILIWNNVWGKKSS